MTCKDIIEKYLRNNGFDGLFSEADGGCGCTLDDLAPCPTEFRDAFNCQPGYKCTLDDGEEGIGPNKQGGRMKKLDDLALSIAANAGPDEPIPGRILE